MSVSSIMPIMRRLLLLVVLALPMPGVRALAQPVNHVALEHLPNGRWRATYHLAAPVTALRFERPASFFRERIWTVLTPGYRFVRDGDAQVARLDSNATAQRVLAFEFVEYADNLPKEYELFQPFSGGAVAVYTGHFHATAIASAGEPAVIHTLIVEPPRGGHAIVRGRVHTARVTFTDSIGDGTYIYLGHTKPIETPDMVAVVDPGMPRWLADQFAREVPRLFAAYRQQIGYALLWKPVVLYSFHDTASSGLSSGGGTLTGLVNMTLSGSAWKTQTPGAVEQAFYLMAHESSHLWNGHLIENVDQGSGSWMHEGSADAMATEIMYALGVIDSTRYRTRREEVINRCAKGVSAGSIATAMSRSAIKDVYDCGFVMAMWSVAAVRQTNPGATLFAVWHDLITQARTTNSEYDQARYFALLQHDGVTEPVLSSMRAFLANRDSMKVAIDGLKAAGVPVATGEGAPPIAFQQELARAAMVHLMSQSCHRVNFSFGVPMRTGVVPDCAPFAVEHQVFGIGGHAVRDDGAQLYDAVLAACAAQGNVSLDDADRRLIVNVPCTRPLAPRPPWYRLASP